MDGEGIEIPRETNVRAVYFFALTSVAPALFLAHG